MKKRIRNAAAVAAAALVLTGCGTSLLEEGTACLEQGDYVAAADTFMEAVQKDSEDSEAWRGLGLARWEQKDYGGALEAFRNVLEKEGDPTGELYNLMGNCSMELEDTKGALQYYGLGLKSEDISEELKQEMRWNEIAAYEKAGDVDHAREKLDSYMQDYPDDEKAAKEAEFLKTR